jgi:hypothetical protein
MSNKDLYWKGKQWAVSENGLQSLDGEIIISPSDLISYKSKLTPGVLARWPIEMSETLGVNYDDFVTAWLVALAFFSFGEVEREQLLVGLKIATQKRNPS